MGFEGMAAPLTRRGYWMKVIGYEELSESEVIP